MTAPLRLRERLAELWTRVVAVARLRSPFLPEQNELLFLAIVIGLLTGLGSVGFIKLLAAITEFARSRLANGLGLFGPADLVLLPALGGLMVGPLIQMLAREARGHGVPEVMTALATQGGRIRPRVAIVKIVASALTIGFGGAAGREGPMIQIGSTFGSSIAQWARLPAERVRTLVACGAAGGIAATFNAPIAGALFSMEVLMGSMAGDFLLVLLTSLTSCLVTRHYLGNYPAFVTPGYDLLYAAEHWFERWSFPWSLKPAVGGLMVGIVLRYFPEIYGTGFPAMESALWVRLPWVLLAGLFFAEMAGNCATLGSGGSGGVFAPSLYMGAMLGGVFGTALDALFPGATGGAGPYAMVGMAAVFAAAAKAPATSILILFEMTNDYRIILPLMAATVASVSLSHRLLPHSIYTLKLHLRGIRFPYEERLRTAADEGEALAAVDH